MDLAKDRLLKIIYRRIGVGDTKPATIAICMQARNFAVERYDMAIERMKLSRLGAFVRRGGGHALFPLILAIALGVGWWITSEEVRLLENDGVDTTATVISKDWSIRSGTNGNASRYYYVEVEFSAPPDQTISETSEVGSSFYSRLEEGDEIDIRYFAHDPTLVEIDPSKRSTSAFWLGQLGLLMLVWFLGMIWHYWRESAKTFRAVNLGEVREARVTGHVSDATPGVKDTRKKKERRYMLRWDDARDTFGMGGSLREDELEKYPKGTVIVTYTDPVSGETYWEGQI
ncbi:DUF3592 domain-containing protein [Histidinibacterium lentulum]|uniref:DUF3592 domain-containing protein n=1 Tax=Histidinibacterium lentulum TaxID=2480588 RepID=UPI0016109AB5|nr:DUF3592 domain-containing protein [Histidinibacterium lentulum]